LSIKVANDKKKWFIETKNMVYVIGIDEKKNLQHLYWGEKLPYVSDYPRVLLPQEFPFDNFEQIIKEEFSSWGGIRYKEPGIKVIYEDQVRDLILINDKRVNEGVIVEKICNGSGSGDYQFSGSRIRP